MQEPDTAVVKACQWRAAALAAMCSESLGVVAEALKQKGSPSSWQFRQLNRNLTGIRDTIDAYMHLLAHRLQACVCFVG